jgi:ATP-dependent RNA helicase HelY
VDERSSVPRGYPFELDRFQLEAIAAIDAGRHVVVAAPTSSGKTVVAEHGIEVTKRRGQRSFYTAPLKALSNQKYRDLTQRYGPGEVGLLTGDNAIDGDARTVVMTTEVLRNMIYARSAALADLGLVVLDEVHYLQDAYRGPVWEEVIIHLPAHVALVCLSATVSNADELAAWIETVRGPTSAIVETRRPVRLEDHYLVGDRTNDRLYLLPTFVGGIPNPDATKIDAQAVRRGGRFGPRPTRGSGQRVLYTPGRLETIELLERRGLLPAIYFIFSRNQCEEAARNVAAGGLRLTDAAQREAIREILADRLAGLDDDDLAVLGYGELVAELDAGVAPHHAGMVPAFKEAVEQCFAAGLLGAVFATETLAVGINMPARTVVIEKLTKFTGDHHELLTPGEYTQLTGRAGRRGIDVVGQAVVSWSPFVPFDRVAALAGSRTFHLRSAFRPTYNMAANLVRTYTSEQAHHLLNLSFAQYQADRDVVRFEARAERLRTAAAAARADAESPYGDIWAYRAARAAARSADGRSERESALSRLRPGDVVEVDRGRYRGPAVMVASAVRKAGMRLTVISADAEALLVTADDVIGPIEPLGKVRLPGTFLPKDRQYRREVAKRLGRTSLRKVGGGRRRDRSRPRVDPVELDPDLRMRMRAAAETERMERELTAVERRVEGQNRTLSREFDRVISVLERRGYLQRTDHDWGLTAKGTTLASVFHECDLLITECLSLGLLDGVDAPELAGLLSVFVYEHRSPEPPVPPWFPGDGARQRWRRIVAISEDLGIEERASGLGAHRPPDPGFFAAAHGWIAGHSLSAVVADEQLTGGDFVRTTKQLVDLARQLADVAPEPATRAVALEVAELAYRGIVADAAIGAPT